MNKTAIYLIEMALAKILYSIIYNKWHSIS